MSIRRLMSGLAALVGFAGREAQRTPTVDHLPREERWREPRRTYRTRWGANRRPRDWWAKRKSRLRMAKESRRRNRP